MSFTMKTPEKVSLLLALIAFLHQQGATEVSALATHFGVPEETVRSMVRFIGTAGVPGDSASYLHNDLYDIDWDLLELEDTVHLTQVVGVDGTPKFTSTQATAMLAGLHVLGPMLNDDEAQAADSAAHKLKLATITEQATLSLSLESDLMSERLSLISTAITSSRQLRFHYLDREGISSTRLVEPHHLMQLQGAWYLEAWCTDREAQRMFRCEFMSEVSVSSLPNTHLPVGEVDRERRVVTAEAVTVHARIDADALYLFDVWHPKVLHTDARGGTHVAIDLVQYTTVLQLVTVAPTRIEITAPAEARTLVADWAHSLATPRAQHDSTQDSIHSSDG